MRKTVLGAPRPPSIGFIILPMIDVIFLLLLFFVMVTSFEASARSPVEIPHPEKSRARQDESSNRIVINCEYVAPVSPGAAKVIYRMDAYPPEALPAIAERLIAARAENRNVVLLIRADRRLVSACVRSVIRAAADAGIETVNVSAQQDLEP